jgi:FkbH-like protein
LIKPLISFLEASQSIIDLKELSKKDICIKTSVSLHQLNIYLKEFGARSAFDLNIKLIEFGTLKQSLYQENDKVEDIFILFPWDFLGSLDWRTGVYSEPICLSSAKDEIDIFFNQLSAKANDNVFFMETDIPPVTGLRDDLLHIREYISLSARKLNCTFLNSEFFCLKTYLANGCPFSSASLSHVANIIIDNIFGSTKLSKKVLVTDLDFTFWHGVLGEVGPSGVESSASGKGYIHFIYQSFLKKLKDAGILLCISSKNDDDLIENAFKQNDFVINYDEFVSIQASYNPKSSQIEQLSNSINIGLQDIVFIDDNPIEIEEVKVSLPNVTCIQFPKEAGQLPKFFDQIHCLFPIKFITQEDTNRTDLYKSMKSSTLSLSKKETDIKDFLKSLSMEMNIHEKNSKNNNRAVQLINKTNQFNLNGIRRSKDECDELLENGARLITASLSDKNGYHGEILAILIDKKSRVLSFVMSCRVFQRQAEIIFIYKLFNMKIEEISMDYLATDRNEPFRIFLSNFFEEIKNGHYSFNEKLISDTYPNINELFMTKRH